MHVLIPTQVFDNIAGPVFLFRKMLMSARMAFAKMFSGKTIQKVYRNFKTLDNNETCLQ